MRSSAAARRYARALFSLAQEEGSVASIGEQLAAMGRLLDEHDDLRRRLFQPIHPVKQRLAVLSRVCERGGISRTIRNFLSYLIDQRRLVDFDNILEEFERLANEAAGRLQADVRAASPLRDEQRERLVQALARRTGKQIDLRVEIDPTLLGGAIASVGGLVIDGSVRSQLSALRSTLTQGHLPQDES